MILRKLGPIEWLEFELLQGYPELVHGVFLRHGGLSKTPFTSLNFGGGEVDDSQLVHQNRALASLALGVKEWAACHQVHGTDLKAISDPKDSEKVPCDGISTAKSNLALIIKHADCQAAIFFDPKKRVIANVHCGWRGCVANMYAATIDHLEKVYGSCVQDLIVCISPSLGPENAEFVNYKVELPPTFLPFQVSPNHFDFWEIAKWQLIERGILDDHIEIAKICTFSTPDDFFSHRREKKTGRNGTLVALKD